MASPLLSSFLQITPDKTLTRRWEQTHAAHVADELSVLCDVASLSAQEGRDYHSRYADLLVEMRRVNLAFLPATPLSRDRLELLAGFGQLDLFENELAETAGAPRLDPGDLGTRAVIIDRVLQDTTAVVPAIRDWLNKGHNLKLADAFAQGANAQRLLTMEIHKDLSAAMRGPKLLQRINAALQTHHTIPLLLQPSAAHRLTLK